jgi:hypothetical protein
VAITLPRASPQFRAPCCDSLPSLSSPLFRNYAFFAVFFLSLQRRNKKCRKSEIKSSREREREGKRPGRRKGLKRASRNNTFLLSLSRARTHIYCYWKSGGVVAMTRYMKMNDSWQAHNTYTRSLGDTKRERRLLTFSLSLAHTAIFFPSTRAQQLRQ